MLRLLFSNWVSHCPACVWWVPATGSFSEDEGQGTYYYSNGNIYTGGMRAGKKHGSGQLFFKVRVQVVRMKE